MDPPAKKGGSTLDLPYQSCHTRASRGTTPEFRASPTAALLLGIDRLLPKAMVVPRDHVKQSGSSCISSDKLA